MPGSSEDTWGSDDPGPAPSGRREHVETGDPADDATLASSTGADIRNPTSPPSAGSVGGAFEPGNAIGRFVILAKLGAGGMGIVYAAYDPQLDRKVALKLLLPDHASHDGAARTRLLREAQALAKLAHPNVVGVYDVGTVSDGGQGERVWIAMEYVDGQTLTAWSKTRARTWREVLDVMTKVGRGVAAAHAALLLHRDLKPDNVMVGRDGRVRVMDFGLARSRDAGEVTDSNEVADPGEAQTSPLSIQLTRAGSMLGTPAYMAPEQFEGEPATPWSDQFSLCVTFWEALYGQRPFAGRSIVELMTSTLEGTIQPPPRGVRVPRWLHAIVATGLAREPSKRFPSVEALVSALARGESRVRVRRAGLAMAVLGLGVVAVYAAQRHDLQRRTDACVAAGDSIDEVWNADARAALRAGLIATEVRYAPTVADKTMPWIDAQAATWRHAATEACMNASVDERWDPDTLAKATFCLEDRRIELATLVDELADADATVIHRAVQAAASLSPIATCLDEGSLASMPEPPDPTMRVEIAEVRADLSRAAYLQSAGKIPEGLGLARTVRERAESLEWPPLTAAALALEAALLEESGNYAEAETTGLAAYLTAQRARSYDVAATAGSRLVGAIARQQGRGDEARVWIELAAVAAEFAGDPLELHEADRLHALGNLDSQAKQHDRAIESFERAGEILTRVLGPDHPRVALGLSSLANAHYRKGEIDQAMALHEQVLEIRERALGPVHPDVSRTLFNLGVMHDELGQRAEARALYERSLALDEVALGPEHPDLAHALINLGNALQRQGEFADSKPHYERALVLAERALGPDHLEIALLLDNLGIAHEELGELDAAEDQFVRALRIRERALPADDPELAFSQRNLAEVQLARGDYEQARVSFEATLALLRKAHGPEDLKLAKPTQRLGETLAKLGRHAEAFVELERALTLRTTSNGGPEDIAEGRFALAVVLWDTPAADGGDRARALALAEQARDGYQGVEGWEFELGEVEAWLTEHP